MSSFSSSTRNETHSNCFGAMATAARRLSRPCRAGASCYPPPKTEKRSSRSRAASLRVSFGRRDMSPVQSVPYTCDTCRQPIAVCDGISYGSIEHGYRQLCSRCFNEEIARTDRIDFQHVDFQPLEMSDAAGQRHEFHFRVHLLGDRVALDAFELRDDEPGGYYFQALGDPHGDLF